MENASHRSTARRAASGLAVVERHAPGFVRSRTTPLACNITSTIENPSTPAPSPCAASTRPDTATEGRCLDGVGRGVTNKVLTVYESAATTNWTLRKDYIYRDGLLTVAENYPEGTTHHLMLDHLRTPRVLTDAQGHFVSTHSHFGFGEEIKGALIGVDTEKMVFTGHERNFSSNLGGGDDLDYIHARYCNPNTGRFLECGSGPDFCTVLASAVMEQKCLRGGEPFGLYRSKRRAIVYAVCTCLC